MSWADKSVNVRKMEQMRQYGGHANSTDFYPAESHNKNPAVLLQPVISFGWGFPLATQ